MARYHFDIEGDAERGEVELPDDAAAWSELVQFCGEVLKDVDGKLPPHADLNFSVSEGERKVADIRVCADRHAKFPQA
jgi:hypothetical protein